MIDVLISMDELNTSLMSQILWSGFKTAQVGYTRLERKAGKSRWSLSKNQAYRRFLLGFSTVPVKAIGIVGSISFAASLVWLACYLIYCFAVKTPLETLTVVCPFAVLLFWHGDDGHIDPGSLPVADVRRYAESASLYH